MIKGLIARFDQNPLIIDQKQLELKTEPIDKPVEKKTNKHAKQWIQESIRQNIPYLGGAIKKPIFQALKSIRGL